MKVLHIFLLLIVTGLVSMFALYRFSIQDSYRHNSLNLRQFHLEEGFDPLSNCTTPFGTLLGVANHVPAFSNCNVRYKSSDVSYVALNNPMDVSSPFDPSVRGHIMIATRYGAMDYVMRWMLYNRGVMPHLQDDVQGWWGTNYYYNPAKTVQDWDAEYINNYAEGKSVEERKFISPRSKDIIAYMKNLKKGFAEGHAAVIVEVEDDVEAAGGRENLRALKARWMHPRKLYLAEQNIDNVDWGGRNYSRIVYFKWRLDREDSSIAEGYIEDPLGLIPIGRMRVGKMRPIRGFSDRYQVGLNQLDDDL